MRLKGTLIEWNDDRGFGFIEPAERGGHRVFCHISHFVVRSRRPSVGYRVTYELSNDGHGRPRATQIRPVEAVRSAKMRTVPSSTVSLKIAVIASIVFLLIVIGLVFVGRLPWLVPFIYLLMSIITMFAYGFDKSAAMNNRWRTKEGTLHFLESLGGWPGAWISQQLFRHKTSKASFQAGFAAATILNVALVAWAAIAPSGPMGMLLWSLPMARF
jgi:uncharacterized membrane protein YsdA (DUF1294 family)/cold shock CspA family protein